MSHDKVVYYIDHNLKDLVPEEMREELLALHYQSIHNAKTAGKQGRDDAPPEPTPPPNRIITEPFPLGLMYIIGGAALILTSGILLAIANT